EEFRLKLIESYSVTGDTPVKVTDISNWQAPAVYVQKQASGEWHVSGGWIPDLVNTLEQTMNFTCSMSLSADRKFGSRNADGSWSGMVGMVGNDQADIIVATLDNTLARGSVVDFLIAIDVTGYMMVMKAANEKGSVWTNYTSEFSGEVWVSLAALLCCSSVVLFVTLTYSPHETRRLSFPEICSLVIAALASQGCDCWTTATSGRIAWLTILCTAVLVSVHYTSWMYSALTINVPYYPFDGFQSLLDNGRYTLGIVQGVAVETELKDSRDATVQRVWNEIVKPKGIVRNSEEGLERAKKDGFVFMIVEGVFYGTNIDACDYAVLPKRFFKFPSGFAVKKGSPLGILFNRALLTTINTGVLRRIKRRWEKRKPDCLDSGVSAMTVKQMTSAFLLLALGLGLAAFIAGCEKLWKKKREPRRMLL
ncbi:Ionotropic receptor 193, partial [Hyalella azteca]